MSVYEDARAAVAWSGTPPTRRNIAQALIDLVDAAEIGHAGSRCRRSQDFGLDPARCNLCATLRRIRVETG